MSRILHKFRHGHLKNHKRSLWVSLLHTENFTFPRHSASHHQPWLYPRTVTHRHSLFLHRPICRVSLGLPLMRFPSGVAYDQVSLVFFRGGYLPAAKIKGRLTAGYFRSPCQCSSWEGTVIHLQHMSSPCPSPSSYLFSDSFHVSALAHLFTPHSHWPIYFFQSLRGLWC